VRCPRCGNENPGTNRFCGMCGATLLPASAGVSGTIPISGPNAATGPVQAAVPAPSARSVPANPIPAVPAPAPPVAIPQNSTAPRTAQPITEERSSISGPSFLGLNDPPPRKRASLSIAPSSIDPLSIGPESAPRSSSLDYLLEDEEPTKSGAWKVMLVLVVLALAAGLGYMRWKNQSFGWVSSGPSKPVAATQPSDDSDSSAPAPSPSATPGSSSATQTPADSPAPQPAVTQDPAAGAAAPDPAPPIAAAPPPATKKASAETEDGVSVPTAKPKPTTVAPAKPTPTRALDPVTEAQKYIYGKGVPQDCDHGLRLLKPAADRANPKAMIEMGALYSAGLCTPHDLPTAYRWFAMALHKDPDNQAVQIDLQKLWSEMTQPERQLAIKLSQ
jgi:hypothetical protein